MAAEREVVIPWRGFRCFTQETGKTETVFATALVVIPWRGFRCFTHALMFTHDVFDVVVSCNPLAGI